MAANHSPDAIVNNRLYFCSGNYTFDDGAPFHNNSNFYSLDLTQPFPADGPIPLANLSQSPLPTVDLAGGVTPVAGGFSGALFYDHTTLFAYSAILGRNSNGSNNALWSYDTMSSAWSLKQVEGGQIAFGSNSEGLYASDPSTGLSFYTGGWQMAFNNTNNGIVRFDSSDPTAPQWNFATTQTGMQGPDILKGAMSFVRKGKAGVLIAFGGYNTTHRGTEFGPGWDWNQALFSDVYVYDIFSNTWSVNSLENLAHFNFYEVTTWTRVNN